MSELNPHDLIKSVSIELLIEKRDAVIHQLEDIQTMLTETDRLSKSAGLGGCEYWLKDYHGAGWLKPDDLIKTAVPEIDATGWQYLMHESGMRSYMDQQARHEWDEKIQNRNTPPLTFENIRATFTNLRDSKNEIFERGVINIFRSLSWDYKTNCPCKFGKKIILDNRVHYQAHYGFFIYTSHLNVIVDIERIMKLFNQEPIPDHRNDISQRLHDAVRAEPRPEGPENTYEDDLFFIRWYKKGSLHITFKKTELVDAMNTILVKHYPHALPARV